MENSLNKIAQKVLDYCKDRAGYEEAQYVINCQDRNLEVIAKEYFEKGFSERRLSMVVSSFQSGIHTLISEENIPNLAKKIREQVTQKAIEKNIHLNKPLIKYYETEDREEYQWFTKGILDLRKVDKSDRIKERLKWINCLTEFYCGQPLFVELVKQNQQKDDINKPIKSPEKLSAFEKSKNQLIEENFTKTLLQAGYLQCDLNR